MDEMQAALLRAKLPHLDRWNARRREIAAAYDAALGVPSLSGEDYVAHLYVIRTGFRDEVRAALAQRGIATDIHYPVPDYLQAAAPPLDIHLPATELAAREVLTLPCYAELTDDVVATVCAALPQEARVG
jgi:dTDP-4-amino-4,6-dideoxygalactose transaminase